MGTATKQQKNVPRLRFPSFKDVWKDNRIGDFSDIKSGNTFQSKYQGKKGEELLYIKVADIGNTKNLKYLKTAINSVSKEVMSEINAKPFRAGSTVFPRVGAALLNNNKKILHKDSLIDDNVLAVSIFDSKLCDDEFFYYWLSTKQISEFCNNGLVPVISASRVKDGKIPIPSLPEQQKIADFLGSVDSWLDNLRQQLTSLETYKRGMMQKLFTQQVRFKDDSGKDFSAWEQKKLGSVFSAINGIGIPKADVVEDGEHECVLYGELYTKYREVITDVVSRTNSADGLPSLDGDLLIPTSTTTSAIDLANVTAINKAGVKLAGGICVLRAKLSVNANFYAYYLSHHKRTELAKYGQGVTIYHIYYSQFKKMEIDLPDVKEQEKIADFLTSIDQAITVKSEEIAKVEQWKKGLMQKMFV